MLQNLELPYPLREYQVGGINFLASRQRAGLADAMGSGKTAQALLAAQVSGAKNILICCTKNGLGVWQSEAALWVPSWQLFTYVGTPTQRQDVLEEYLCTAPPRALLAVWHPHVLTELATQRFDTVIGDEFHRLRGRKTQLFKVFGRMTRHVERLFALTGTPVMRHPLDLLPLIMLLDPTHYRSYWTLVYRYFHVVQGVFGQEIGELKDPALFQLWVSKYFLRRDKLTTLPGLPPKTRRLLPLTPTPKQRALYEDLADDMMARTSGRLLLTPTILSLLTRLRQVLVSPRLLDPHHPEVGAAMEWLLEYAEESKEREEPFVVFTAFPACIDILQPLLEARGIRCTVVRGHMSAKQLLREKEAFQNGETHAALCAVTTAESYSLSRARRVFFLAPDWNAATNFQAEDRVHRPGQEHHTVVDYFYHPGYIDQSVLELINVKVRRTADALTLRNAIYPTDVERR